MPSNKTFVTQGDQRNNVASVLAVHYEYSLKPSVLFNSVCDSEHPATEAPGDLNEWTFK